MQSSRPLFRRDLRNLTHELDHVGAHAFNADLAVQVEHL